MIGGLIYTGIILFAGWCAWKKWVRPTIVIPPAVEEPPKRWNFQHLWPKAKEPTADDILVAKAPKPVDPFGRMSDRRFRELAAEVAAEGPAYRPEVPSVDRYCNCGTARFSRGGALVCPECDLIDDNRLEMA